MLRRLECEDAFGLKERRLSLDKAVILIVGCLALISVRRPESVQSMNLIVLRKVCGNPSYRIHTETRSPRAGTTPIDRQGLPATNTRSSKMKKMICIVAVAGLVFALAPAAQAVVVSQLGILDLTADYGAGAGINPTTEAAWALDDPYYLIFVTSTETGAIDDDMTYYTDFVNTAANLDGSQVKDSGLTWTAIGSTSPVNAKDDVPPPSTCKAHFLI